MYRKESSMIDRVVSVSIVCAMFILSGCMEKTEHLRLSKEASKPANPYRNPYDARSYRYGLEVFEGGKRVCHVRSGRGSIERWGFIDDGEYIAVRSEDRNGRTLLELFETNSCKRVDEVEWPDSESGASPPEWASSLFD